MIEINCSCGAHFEVINEQVAQRARCPRCGARASDILAQAEQLGTAEDSVGAEPGARQFQVACTHHPDQPATHNCMNCAKPLCMTCVRENGYYCSDDCRAAVSSAEPSTAPDSTPTVEDDEKFERVLAMIFAILKKVALLAVLLLAGYVGYIVYQDFWGPRPHVVASLEIMSTPDRFGAIPLDPSRTLVQADDELSLLNVTTQQKQWKVDVRSLEEPLSASNQTAEFAEAVSYSDSGELRDPLTLLDVKGDDIILRSQRQLVALKAQTGGVLWKLFQPDTSLSQVLPHNDGLLCVLSTHRKGGNVVRPRATCLAFDDGHELWSDPDGSAYLASVPVPGQRVLSATRDVPATATSTNADEEEFTASGIDVSAFRSAMFAGIQRAMASGSLDVEIATDQTETEKDQPPQNYTIRFHSLENGTDAGRMSISARGIPQIESVGPFACVVAGRDLLVFGNESQPLWQTSLGATPRLLSADSNLFAVAAGNGVIAFDAKNGRKKWARDNLKPSRLVVGPDDGVYVTIKLSRNDFMSSEGKNFRSDDIFKDGSTDPRVPVQFLMKLDRKSGVTSWGVRNIGADLVFAKDVVYAFDTTTEIRLLSNTGLSVTYNSVHCLSQRSGREVWGYVGTGTVHAHAILDKKAFFVLTEGTPIGTLHHAVCNYRMCLVDRK
ncbi:MAG TPA: PQQ-binding-like beta-propeller repeat protein [Verrucomicrobiae bacterium]|nr:PQQ-binding-like beta-propeller repeat protein [Verrucomicrobiae bacterium]